jgi:ferredoxin
MKEDSVKVTVDETLCSGCGVCEEMAPDVFEMNDAGLVAVKVDPIPEDLQESTQEAADGCPSGAILIEA